MYKRIPFILLSAIVIAALLPHSAHAGTPTLDEARELYKAGRYEEVAPVFEKELKRKPNDGSLNHWYGVCLYETGEYEASIPYLKKAASRRVLLSNYYLGQAYAAACLFDEAIEAYEMYVTALKKDKREPDSTIMQKITSARLGSRMISGVERVQVIDSLTVDSLSFFEAYRLTPESGRLVSNEELPFDLPQETPVVAFVPQRNDIIFMGYPLTGDNYDLCVSNSLLGGQWSRLQSLSATLNTADNQSFPFMLADGQTLYYAQDGENSLGGYDIFITRFSSEREDYMLPQNIGMPFNSIFNDYMLAIDETMGVGWFVSDRNHIPGKLTVYLFIPNTEKEIYTDEPDERLRRLARISSIKETWREGADYSQLLDAIAQIDSHDAIKPKREFTFVLCNGIIYTRSQDFHNAEALRYYNMARDVAAQLSQAKEQLDKLRRSYAQSSPAEKAKLQPSILALEKKIEQIRNQPSEYEKRARRSELSFRNML